MIYDRFVRGIIQGAKSKEGLILIVYVCLVLWSNRPTRYFRYQEHRIIVKKGEVIVRRRKLADYFGIRLDELGEMIRRLETYHLVKVLKVTPDGYVHFRVLNKQEQRKGHKQEKEQRKTQAQEKEQENKQKHKDQRKQRNLNEEGRINKDSQDKEGQKQVLTQVGQTKEKHSTSTAQLIKKIKGKANGMNIVYNPNQEMVYADRIIRSGAFRATANKYRMSIEGLACYVMQRSKELQYWKGVCSGTKSIYENYADVLNAELSSTKEDVLDEIDRFILSLDPTIQAKLKLIKKQRQTSFPYKKPFQSIEHVKEFVQAIEQGKL